MMRQYREARNSLDEDTLLLFRLGDFFEMFESDAERGAALLGITLTKRHDMPMAGIPSHAAEGYITKLLNLGHKVAICDQLEAPQTGKLVKRGITRILTPGTVLEDGQLDAGHNHFLLSVDFDKKGARASWLDISTGKFVLTHAPRIQDFLAILGALAPREVLVPEGMEKRINQLEDGALILEELDRLFTGVTKTERPDFDFEHRSGAREVMESLGVMNLEGFGIDVEHPGLGPAGALLVYASDVLRGKPGNLRRIEEYRTDNSLLLDPATQRNLEIFKTSAQTKKGSLMDAMDQTVTSAGSRLLESYLGSPECDLKEIERRQACVKEFSEVPSVVDEIASILRTGSDLERILGRLRNRLVRPRELGGLRSTIRGLPSVSRCLLALKDRCPSVFALAQRVQTFEELCEF